MDNEWKRRLKNIYLTCKKVLILEISVFFV